MISKIKTLVVEDVFLIQRIIQKLTTNYTNCHAVQNGIEAVEKFKSEFFNGEPFELIYLDIYIPEMNGIEVLENIRAFERELKIKEEEKVKIVMVSSLSHANMIKKARKLGCNGYITKPFSKDQIIDELRRLKFIAEAEDTI